MEDLLEAPLLVETSPLISFLKISRFDLLEALNTPLACTDFVRAEVKRPGEALETLLAYGRITAIPLIEPTELLAVEQLYEKGLGRGEASSIILARQRGYALVIDDRRARKLALAENLQLYSTADIVIHNIQLRHLALSEADSFIASWQSLGEFPVTCKSFKELIP